MDPRKSGCARALLVGAVLGAACRQAPPGDTSPVVAQVGALPMGPATPEHGLPFTGLDVGWSPPVLVAGDVRALSAAIDGAEHVAVRSGPRLSGPMWQQRLQTLVERLGGSAVEVGVRPLAEDLAADHPLRLTVPSPAQGDAPLDLDAVRLRPTWDEDVPPVASAVLWVDDAALEPSAWRALPARTSGSCEPILEALARGQESSLAWLEPFLDHADAVLAQVFQANVRAGLPQLQQELSGYARPATREQVGGERDFAVHQCGHAYFELAQVYATCLSDGGCPMAPRVFLIGGARIGMPRSDVFIPDGCAKTFGTDVEARILAWGDSSAQAAADHLDTQWTILADRLGTVTEVYDALVDVCAPRRRRFAPADLDEARRRMVQMGVALASDESVPAPAEWKLERSRFHVPGVGAVTQLGRYDAGPGSANRRIVADARGLRQFVLSRALCRFPGTELPLVVALAEPGRDHPSWSGLFYEEELVCSDLGPRDGPPK